MLRFLSTRPADCEDGEAAHLDSTPEPTSAVRLAVSLPRETLAAYQRSRGARPESVEASPSLAQICTNTA